MNNVPRSAAGHSSERSAAGKLFGAVLNRLGGGKFSSIRARILLLVLGIAATALLLAGAAMLGRDVVVDREAWMDDLRTEASILALSTAPALAFEDRATAQRNLSALQAREELLVAALYDRNGALYADYRRDERNVIPPALPVVATSTSMTNKRLEVAHRIVQHGEFLGTIYLRANYDLWGRVGAYATIWALVTGASMIAALLLSAVLQKGITIPLETMTVVARRVVDERDYSQRAQKSADDELGLVVDAFNSMLDEVQARTRALEESNRALLQEIATRQDVELGLARANARLESTMAAAEIGAWIWDIERDEVTADRNLAVLYGIENETQLRGDPMLRRRYIHPDDLAAVVAAESLALQTGALPSLEYRIVQAGGEVRWVVERGKVQFDAEGNPAYLAGLLIDITAKKQAEFALNESERLYRAIGESIDYGVWVCDAEGRNTYASDSFLSLTGMTQEECSNVGWGQLLHPDDVANTLADWRECVRSGDHWYREHRIRGTDGRYHPILARGVPLRTATGEVQGWAGINLDISRLKRTEEALRETDRRKDEFLATLAHELRNPLAPIRHATRILDTRGVDANKQAWARSVIARQVHHMSLLLDDLLDVSRITRGRLELRKDTVTLDSLVASAVETARPLIDSKQHTLQVNLPTDPVQMEVDPLRLSQALSNLLTNAAKYTDPGGHISIHARVTDDDIGIEVADTGIGLSPKTIPKVFEMFSQVESSVDRTQGGLGIGLALVKGLVALHGGEVEVRSDGIGYGSTFTIRLPRDRTVPPKVVKREPPEATGRVSPRCKVLIADDNADGAKSLGMLFEILGYRVCEAHTGREALEVGARERPDVCILDIGMPELSGYDAARAIRREAWGRRALLLAVTGWGQKDDKERARAAGFDHHFTKPVDVDAIERLVNAFAASRGKLETSS